MESLLGEAAAASELDIVGFDTLPVSKGLVASRSRREVSSDYARWPVATTRCQRNDEYEGCDHALVT